MRGYSFVKVGDGAAVTNNNPCNLRFIGQKGSEKGYMDFARFKTPEDGMRACIDEINWDAKKGHTIATLIEENTPRSENDTDGYIKQLVTCVGKPDWWLVQDIPVGKMATCVAKLESQTIITP